MSAVAITILVLCVISLIVNTAVEFERRMRIQRIQNGEIDLEAAGRTALEREEIAKQNAEIQQYLLSIEKKKKIADPDYITDAEIIE